MKITTTTHTTRMVVHNSGWGECEATLLVAVKQYIAGGRVHL